MDKDFYNLAVRLMANISRVEPNLVSGHDAEMCVILTDQQHVYAGITGVRISNGQLMRACPEFNAIMSMVPAGESRVDKMITVSFAHHTVSPPCEGCLDLLLRVNADNKDTRIFDGPNHFVYPEALMHDESLSDQLADMFFFADGNHAIVGGVASIPTTPAPAQAPAEEAAAAEETAPAEAAAEEAAPAEEAAETTPAEAATEEAAAAEETAEAVEAPAEEKAFVEEVVPDEDNPFAAEVEPDEDNPFAEASGEAPPVQSLGVAASADEAASADVKVDGAIQGASSMVSHPAGIPEAAAMAIADAVAAAEGEHAADPDDQFAQFGFEAGDPVEFVEEVKHDEDNPFYEPPVESAEQDPNLPPYMRDPRAQQPRYLYEQPQYDSMQQPAMGYEDPESSMYASQAFPGGGRKKGLFQPGQTGAVRPGVSRQQSQYAQSQYVSQPFQPSQPGQPGQQGQSQYVSQQFGQGQSQYLSAQPPQPGQSQYVSQHLNPGSSQMQPLRGPGQVQPGQPFRPGQTQPQQAQPFRPGQSGSQQSSMYAQQSMPYTPQGMPFQPSKQGGGAFRQRLSAFMRDDGGSEGGENLTQSEMMRLAKEKKKKAKIDAQFKKEMKKKGF
ncbi:MAG: hypothetical protein K5695_06995 [Oscillospiraceae bacterium]|nr:hypothetical protein [Oscillospiraceae bacterium]